MTDSLFSVAAGSSGTSVELDRQQYTIKRPELSKALALIRTSGRELGRGAAARRQQWRDEAANAVRRGYG
ncbi:hypothetical protein [Nocardia gipuzkoensis]|nr:hypothetical protein [Streptomyces gardneri]